MTDREIEKQRYNRAAIAESELAELPIGAEGFPSRYREPYDRYNQLLGETLTRESVVLELGAGGGRHTVRLTSLSDFVLAIDVSSVALSLLQRRTKFRGRPVCADIESLPIADSSVDVVAAAGSLSYGEPAIVDAEIRRVLKPGGSLVIVDSLNGNPIYRINRWLHCLRGERTRSTLRRIPDSGRIQNLCQDFETVELDAYGTFLFLHPALARIVGAQRSQRICEDLDDRFGHGPNGFKFVLCARGFERK